MTKRIFMTKSYLLLKVMELLVILFLYKLYAHINIIIFNLNFGR